MIARSAVCQCFLSCKCRDVCRPSEECENTVHWAASDHLSPTAIQYYEAEQMLRKVIWEECVAIPLVTMGCPKFTAKTAPSPLTTTPI